MNIRAKLFLRPLLARLINIYRVRKGDFRNYEYSDYWQDRGFHIISNHYYNPIPDTSILTARDFGKKSMVGIRINDTDQLRTLKKLSKYRKEFSNFKILPKGINTQKDPSFYFGNMAFDGIDALTYYGMIRMLKPRRVLEVGSGWSTKIAANACFKNGGTELISVEPYPQPILRAGFPGFSKLIDRKVEDVSLELFEGLGAGDILFIDSSHTVRIGGDVNYLFFEVLPRLKKGVYVHIHDIFLPYDYPKDWVLKERRFWSEQYLLHAFLLFNDSFEIVLASGYVNDKYPNKVNKAFAGITPFGGGSFWIRKIR